MPTPLEATPGSYIPLSGNNLIDSLVVGTKWGGAIGQASSLSYSFFNLSQSYYASSYSSDNEYLAAFALTNNQMAAVTNALNTWSAVANLTFVETTDSILQTGDLRFAGYDQMDSGIAAWAYFPSNTPSGGDVWIGPATNDQNPQPGSFDFETFVHEIGHALGLKHPFSGVNGNPNTLPAAYDDIRYSVMSYNDSYDFQATGPMLLDIAAMQYIYGSNNTWKTGDDVYKWDSNEKIFQTIWDAGGNDTIDASNQTRGVTLNLNSGKFSSIGQNIYNYGNGTFNNNFLTIAYGATIENAIGSAFSDSLIGNSVANVLDGRGGFDTLQGGKGNDTYIVDLTASNSLQDSIIELAGEGNDTLQLRGGNAALALTTLTLADTLENLDASATGLTKLNLLGNANNNLLIGNAADNLLGGGTGADTLIGGLGNDTYGIDNIGDTIIEDADAGNDSVNIRIATAGGSYSLGNNLENATLLNAVAFNLNGNALNNVLRGNDFDNTIDGGLGADNMNGGAGNDLYFVDNLGDSITDSAGFDSVRSSITYTIGAALENLSLLGTDAIDGTGNQQNNYINGLLNSAANVLSGLAGNDVYTVGAGDSVIEGLNAGIDLVRSSVSFTLGDNVENLTLQSADAINGSGNALANVLLGNDAANVLDGKDGLDSLQGGKGNDTYIVDLTASNTLQDSIIELVGEGSDTLQLRGGNAALALTSLTLADTLENLDASATGLTKLTLIGNANNNLLIGNAADNILGGGTGADTLIGGLGNDTYGIDNIGDTIIEDADAGNDSVNIRIATAGGSYSLGNNLENATLLNAVAFNLNGNALNNVLRGNDFDNTIDGGLGADNMNGGAGNDLYFVDNLGDSITDSAGFDSVRSSITYTIGAALENLSLLGTDAIDGTGNQQNNYINGLLNSAANVLSGLAGNDVYTVGAGDSVIEGLNAGIDLVRSSVSFTLGDNVENLTLQSADAINGSGNALANVLIGNDAANILDGKAGSDTLQGGKGNDTYIVDLTASNSLQDSIIELAGEGNDTLQLRGGNAALATTTLSLSSTLANLENIDISATGLSKLNLVGNAANNLLIGNAAANVINGGAGNDTLAGMGGRDTLTGGSGADTFSFNLLGNLGKELLGSITDFSHAAGDKINLTAIANFTFMTEGAAVITDGAPMNQVYLDHGVLHGSMDGGHSTAFDIQLLGVSALVSSDFTAYT